MFFRILVFVSLATGCLSQRCRTIPTIGGTNTSEPCVFPFRLQNKLYNGCTPDFDQLQIPWCSVQVDSQGKHVRKRWGYCSFGCHLSSTTPIIVTNRPPVVVTTISTAAINNKKFTTVENELPITPGAKVECHTIDVDANKKCVFPFKFGGKTYNECTTDGTTSGKPWCSTQVDQNGNHVAGKNKYGTCECKTRDGCKSSKYQALDVFNSGGKMLPTTNNLNFVCGKTRLTTENPQHIIGGTSTDLQEFPFAAILIYYKIPGKPIFGCGGTLINRRYVLTAAHCYFLSVQPSQVRIGDFDVTKDCDCVKNLCAPLAQTIDIAKIRVHKNFDQNNYVNDIALVRLAKLADLNIGVGVACLPLPGSDFVIKFLKDSTGSTLVQQYQGLNATVVGWGRTSPFSEGEKEKTGASISIIQKVEIPIISEEICQQAWPNRIIDHGQICAGTFGKDSCKGDSGGPLLMKVDSKWFLVGLVSFGDANCGNGRPAIYTRVENYINWIEQNLEE